MTFAEVIVFLLIMYVLINPVYAAYMFTHPPRIRISFRTPEDLGVPYEKVSLIAKDGAELKGWYISSRNGAVVILLHGHSGNRLGLMFHAETLVEEGYGVLMFDLRAHGSSGGRFFARSEQGVQDVLTAVSYLSKRPDVQPGKMGVMGLSVGGLFALHAASHTITLRAIATDGASPAVMADLPPADSWLDKLLRYPIQQYYMRLCRLFSRQPELLPTLSVIPRLTQPVLFISTGRAAEQRMVRQYYRAAKSAKQLWEVPEAAHATAWHARSEEYARQLVAFFDQHLLKKEPPPPPLATVESFQGKTAESTSLATYDATLSLAWANMVALLMLPLVYLLFFLPYQLIWGRSPFEAVIYLQAANLPIILLVFVGGILVHELLHAAGYLWVGGVPKTAVKIGMKWAYLTPYAHCKAPLTARAYRISVLLPGLVLGILPGLAGVALGSLPLLLWGALMVVSAGGDSAVLWAVRHVPPHAQVLDHPSLAGCVVLLKSETEAISH